jgi:hypothetical protein
MYAYIYGGGMQVAHAHKLPPIVDKRFTWMLCVTVLVSVGPLDEFNIHERDIYTSDLSDVWEKEPGIPVRKAGHLF